MIDTSPELAIDYAGIRDPGFEKLIAVKHTLSFRWPGYRVVFSESLRIVGILGPGPSGRIIERYGIHEHDWDPGVRAEPKIPVDPKYTGPRVWLARMT